MSSIAPFLGCKAARARTPDLCYVHDLGIQRLVVPLVVPTGVDREPASVAFECHLLAPYGAVLECRGACQKQIAL
jgi:hypothetical protein